MRNDLRLKRNETFLIREGWFEKGINIVLNNNNCFKNDNGIIEFGLGANMVKSLKYWLVASNIIKITSNNSILSEFGELLNQYDKYLEDKFSWWLIHYELVTNKEDSPVFNLFYSMKIKKFKKEDLYIKMLSIFNENYDKVVEKSLDSDISVLLRSYCFNDE